MKRICLTAMILLSSLALWSPWPTASSPRPGAASIASDSDRPPLLPTFRLPYGSEEDAEWTGGPHECGNTNRLTTFPEGKGSGLDFSTGGHFEVRAMATGRIIKADCEENGEEEGFGCIVAIQHDEGNSVIFYAHLQEASIDGIGQELKTATAAGASLWVPRGAVIGRAGQTGADEVHLHVELGMGYVECLIDCSADCPEDPHTYPLDWSLARFTEGYQIHPFLVNPTGAEAYNYEGSATQGATHVIPDFPFKDQPGDVPKTAVVTVGPSFPCEPTWPTCELHHPPGTQFGKVPDGGKLISQNEPERIRMIPLLLEQSPNPILKPGEQDSIKLVIQNLGPETWPVGHLILKNVNDQPLGAPGEMHLDADVPSGDSAEWQLPIRAPLRPGTYVSTWRLSYDGEFVGPLFTVEVRVGLDGSLEPVRAALEELWEEIKDRLKGIGDWIQDQWQQFIRGLQEKIWAEIQRMLEELLSGLCCGGPFAMALVVLSLLRLRREAARPPQKE